MEILVNIFLVGLPSPRKRKIVSEIFSQNVKNLPSAVGMHIYTRVPLSSAYSATIRGTARVQCTFSGTGTGTGTGTTGTISLTMIFLYRLQAKKTPGI